MTRRCPPIPVTIRRIDRSAIVLKSTLDASPLVALPAMIGSFLFVIGFAQPVSALAFLPAPGFFIILCALILIGFTIWLRQSIYEIVIDDTSRTISGCPQSPRSIDFCDITSIIIDTEPDKNVYRVGIMLKGGDHLDLARSYPAELAMYLAAHLSRMIARPLSHPRSLDALKQSTVPTEPPFRLPRVTFPVSLNLIAASIAAILVLTFSMEYIDLFSEAIWPHILFLAFLVTTAFRIDHLLIRAELLHVRFATSFALLVILTALVVFGLHFPASLFVFLTLMGIVFHWSIIEPYFNPSHRRKLRAIIGVSLMSVLLPLFIMQLVHFVKFVNLDSGVIDFIVQTDASNIPVYQPSVFKIEKPADIQSFTNSLRDRAVIYGLRGRESEPVFFRVVRRSGESYFLQVTRYETATRAMVRIKLLDNLPLNWNPVRFISYELDSFLNYACKFTSIWPPRIKQ